MATNGRNPDDRFRTGRRSAVTVMGSGAENSPATKVQEIWQHNSNLRPISGTALEGVTEATQLESAGREGQVKANRSFTILVVDDHPVVREGLVALINRRSDMRVIAEASNGQEAVEKFLAQRPDVVLLDLRMPVMGGVETVMAICHEDPTARISMFTVCHCEEDIYRALRAGAQGYVLKEAPADELVACIRAIGEGRTWIPPDVGAKLAKRVADPELTNREREVLHAVATGKSNKEIGSAFNISEATVKVHVTHILEKLKVAGRTEAINVAAKRGLVHLGSGIAA